MISVLSQMGFFAYLTIRFIALSIFRGKLLYWNIIQVILVVVTLFDLAYLRYTGYAKSDESIVDYSILPVVILIVGLAAAYWKVKQTNASAFVPTLFFMVVVSVLEAVPAFNMEESHSEYVIFMMVPLLACNAWQIMLLHKILQAKKS